MDMGLAQIDGILVIKHNSTKLTLFSSPQGMFRIRDIELSRERLCAYKII